MCTKHENLGQNRWLVCFLEVFRFKGYQLQLLETTDNFKKKMIHRYNNVSDENTCLCTPPHTNLF